MIKKIIALVLCLICLVTVFTGCGNMSMGIGNYSYEHIHFFDRQDGYCATIEKWYDCSTGIEVKTKEYGSIFLAEGTYMLFENTCPYCS